MAENDRFPQETPRRTVGADTTKPVAIDEAPSDTDGASFTQTLTGAVHAANETAGRRRARSFGRIVRGARPVSRDGREHSADKPGRERRYDVTGWGPR